MGRIARWSRSWKRKSANRATAWPVSTVSAKRCKPVCASAKVIETGRQTILRLLSEASTIANQLAQIDEDLAGIDRASCRSTREEQVATAEIERLEGARRQLSEVAAQRQLELELVAGERHRTEEELAGQRRAPPPSCGAKSTLARPKSPPCARERSRSNRYLPTAPTTESVN